MYLWNWVMHARYNRRNLFSQLIKGWYQVIFFFRLDYSFNFESTYGLNYWLCLNSHVISILLSQLQPIVLKLNGYSEIIVQWSGVISAIFFSDFFCLSIVADAYLKFFLKFFLLNVHKVFWVFILYADHAPTEVSAEEVWNVGGGGARRLLPQQQHRLHTD